MSETVLAAEQLSPGRALAAARAERNLSLADVSQQIKYGARQIEAIEADDYSKLPGITFVRGMIRSYAKLVQIDPKPLLAGLDRRNIPAAITVDLRTDKHEPFPDDSKKSNRVYAVLSLAVLAAVAIVAYEWHTAPPDRGEVVTIAPRVQKTAPVPTTEPEQKTELVQKTETAQIPLAPVIAAEQPSGSAEQAGKAQALAVQPAVQTGTLAAATAHKGGKYKRIHLEFDKQAWVEIRQANGKAILSQLNAAGTTQTIEGVPPFEVVIGNAASVRLRYNDALIDLRPYFKIDVARLTLD
jgi:cytoskeleton protein RodZ